MDLISASIGESLFGTHRLAIRSTMLAGAALIALDPSVLHAQTVPAQGQEAGEEPVENPAGSDDIVVTGFRQSIKTATEIKRSSTSIVEVISAEDIGKLPDLSIAESLARLSGITGQRVNGRVQVISIRGLPPDFSTTLLNGRQQVSTGDNRAVEFDQYPSELLNGAVIYKSADAGLTGQGLAGTVDLRTVRPLDFKERVITVNLRGETNDIGRVHDDGPLHGVRASGAYIDKFFNDTLGIAIGYAHLDSPTQVLDQSTWYWTTQNGRLGPGQDAALGLGGQEVFARSREQIRDSALAVIEWKPTTNFHSVLDVFYSQFNQQELLRGVQWFSAGDAPDNTQFLNPGFVDVNGTQVNLTGTATNVTPVVRADLNRSKSKLFAIGSNTQFTAGKTTFTLDLGYSQVRLREQDLEIYHGYGATRTFDAIGYDLSLDGRSQYDPGLDYADSSQIQIGDPATWGGWGHEGAIRFPFNNDRLYTVDMRVEHDLRDSFLGGVFSAVQAGIYLNDRRKEKRVDDNDLFVIGRGPVGTVPNDATRSPIDPQYFNKPTSLGFAGIPGVISYDIEAVLDRYFNIVPILDSNGYNKDWSVSERLVTPFLLFKIDSQLGGVRLTGNLGFQYTFTRQRSTGFQARASQSLTDFVQPEALTVSDSYEDFLPTLNLSADFGQGWVVRAAAARQSARPRLDELRASTTAAVSATSLLPSGSGGNPNLRPWISTSLDLTVEKYFGQGSYLSVAGFYKNLKSYIYNQVTERDFTGFPFDPNGPTPRSLIGLYTRPANGSGGEIYGVEISGAFDFGLIAAPLAGFGVIGSYARTETNIRPDGPLSSNTIPGLSDDVRNITVYFERNGFSARIGQRYRSPFRGEVFQNFSTRGFTEIGTDKQTDLQLSYAFAEKSAFSGLTLLFQVNNLFDDPYRTRTGPYGGTVVDGQRTGGFYLPERYETYGRQIIAGALYKF